MNDTSAVLNFYAGRGRDSRGRSFDEILAWGFDRLEGVFDVIPWLFPTDRPSRFHPDAPVLDPDAAQRFREDHALRARLMQAFDRFLAFLGLVRSGDRIEPGPDWAERADVWLVFGDHNHDRVTTVLTSLRLLGLEDEAVRFLRALEAIAGTASGTANIDDGSLQLWRRAAGAR